MLRVNSAAKTVVFKETDESVEYISRSLVSLAPKSDDDSHKEKEIIPIPIRDIIQNYPSAEETSFKLATRIPPTTNEET